MNNLNQYPADDNQKELYKKFPSTHYLSNPMNVIHSLAWCTFWRRNMHRFVRDYLKLSLYVYQELSIYLMGISNFICIIASRNDAKSFIIALYACCRCILYPGTKFRIGSATKKQAKLIVSDKILDELCEWSKKKNKELMQSALKMIDDKMFIRDALHTEMREGTAFYYFDIRQGTQDRNKFMTDYDVENIVEINEIGINARIITLPWRYTKIVGKKNGRYVLAFNLRYFDDFTGEQLDRKLKKYPPEITEGYDKKHNRLVNGDWMILDNNKTMARKIKCKDSEPWGRSLIIAALEDVLYKDYFTDTKRNVLDEINSRIIYETFPENLQKKKRR